MYDAIVIGLGAMGSATVYHLARRGLSVLGLEQYDLIHNLGSSHGDTRIIRKAYFEHPDYVPLLERAYDGWHALAAESEHEIINLCGLVLAGMNDDAVIAGTRRAAAQHGLPLETVAPEVARRRFRGVAPDTEMTVLFDPLGGYLRIENSLRAHLKLAGCHGADIHPRETVLSWSSDGTGVSVVTGNGRYNGKTLVLCAGSWTSPLLGAPALSLQAHRVVSAWFPSDNDAHSIENDAPVFAMQTEHGFFYGFPQMDARGVKIAEHRAGDRLTEPQAIERRVSTGDIAGIRQFAETHVPGLRTASWTANTCIYTMSPDSDFIVDRHPAHENVFIAAGFSGHGFKFSSAIGAIMADLCEVGATSSPVGFLGLDRFGRDTQ